ncbi:sarcosine oxidase subunit delta [Actinacidiphila glaucinigra]|uniref:sarcosine oxidase subunit delta n=1 Tax=Actinacidiphila glaucinigra TaxID=235986 RepID=UPI0033C351CB
MLLIPCPWCGPRDEAEFHYGGQAHLAYPRDPAALTDEEWARHLFFRDNPKGPFAERWMHAAGCRRWFDAVRDTATNRFVTGASAPASSPAPARAPARVSTPAPVPAGEAPRPGPSGPPALRPARDPAQPFRLAEGGRIDRATPVAFTFDGTAYTGYRGDTLASALLANGVIATGTGIRLGRPRGVFSAGVEEPNAVVQIEAPFPEPMMPATTVELYDGLVATGLPGQGRLATGPDPARYDAVHAHCDLLVVGAGPTGLAAAATAAGSGARVILADEQPEPGGSLLGSGRHLDWVAATEALLAAENGIRVLRRTTVFGHYDDNHVLALERRTHHLGAAAPAHVSRERVHRVRARRVVLATGAHERSVAFPDNDRPGVMLAGAARAYVRRYGVVPGRRAVVFTTNDSTGAVIRDLAAAGVEIAAVADARDGVYVTGTEGTDRLTAVLLGDRRIEADLLLVSGGWNPVGHLFGQAGGAVRYDEARGAFVPVPGSTHQAVEFAATPTEGVAAAARALAAEGFTPFRPLLPPPEPGPGRPPLTLFDVPVAAPGPRFVDLQRDVTVADLRRAAAAGMRSVEHTKRYTTAGTANDQGKTSGVLASGVVAGLLGVEVSALGTTTYRPPYAPVSFAALAGRDRGALHDPVRVTALHGLHVADGAVFEDVGQWKRPRHYPRAGEDMAAAVLRECRAAREDVAFMDASTLGKIDVQGPDAAEFLDRLYTNVMSTLRPGMIRYGVMCRQDGMVFDDGTVIRLAEDRFLATTTTGNAAAVLDWMEEWLQTEWPQLRVHCTSVTEQWATVALVGPRSREVLGALAPGLAVGRAEFPFMAWRDATVAGVPARVCRISFSGELAYEINVLPWRATALWEAVRAAGATPYGTETMHVLRAEKGYPIVGQDTDGTVTPQDLGMGWVVSKKKRDFVGKRSHTRADTARPDRKHLVGLLPEDPGLLLPEGTHLVADPLPPRPPVTALGHVSSSYRSAALGRTFALALVKGGRERVGERLYAPVGGRLVPVTVASPVLYDPEGARRDG